MSDYRSVNSVSWRSIPLEGETAEPLRDEFQLSFLRSTLSADPNNLEALVQLGDLYTKLGEIREGLKIDLKLVELCPQEKVFHYNVACSYSLLGDADSALLAMEKALLLGYDDVDHIENDRDLAALREDPRFRKLIREQFKREPQL